MKKNITFVITILLAMGFISAKISCGNSSAYKEEKITEHQQAIHLKTTKPPVLDNSLEREQLIRRLKRFNVANKISYIYLMSVIGQPIGFYTIKGKVSSVNSLLTNPEIYYSQGVTLPSPDLDGSYGSNGDAIFFFTTEDVYVEWNGQYLLSDKPIPIKVPKFNRKK